MRNIYNKGPYRLHEWGKHVRPWLKRFGNKRYRKTTESEITEDAVLQSPYVKKKLPYRKKPIRARITLMHGRFKTSYIRTYKTLRDYQNAISRPNVISSVILSK
jgi:hypothetical protein